MITPLLALALSAPSSLSETLPFAWERASRVTVTIAETPNLVPFEYSVGIKLYLNEKGGGVSLQRAEFQPKTVAGHTISDDERSLLYREWLVRMEHLPNMRIDPAGQLEHFSNVEQAEDAFFAKMTEGLTSDQRAAARFQYGPGIDRELWMEPMRLEWQRWSAKWNGLPLAAGVYSVDRKLYLGMPRKEWLDVQAHVTVSEPFEEDGRERIRIESVVRLNDELMGTESVRYLHFIGAKPSVLGNLQSFETFYRDTAVFDVETWLPVAVHSRRETRMGMETTRAAWVEEARTEHRYSFEWQLREEG